MNNLVLYAQCVNNISTNPTNPTNNSLPELDNGVPYNDVDERYLNRFDWLTPSHYTLTNMQYNVNQPYDIMENIQSQQVLGYYSYFKKTIGPTIQETMNTENGWELLLSNLGYYPDNITEHDETGLRAQPYLVFYNRYRGVIRVFVQYGYNQPPVDAVDGVKINLKYKVPEGSANLSGIFRLAEGIDRALNQETNVQAMSAVAPTNGTNNYWLSADFQITYDPCVCFYPTDITLDFQFYSTTNFKLVGRGVETTEDIVDANGNVVNRDFLSGIHYKILKL